ncbi:hypothetical protein BS17DRAFT_852707 [Gyrodon lividus]|nr:hypothetical protein BS17DRAFT_852707 [Gyrodon lividus]
MCDQQCLLCSPGLEDVQVDCCKCTPAPVHLINHGLFACSPITPSLAVHLRVLELVKNLFARLTPNTMAWCDALESFLDGQGYKLQGQVRYLWHQFSNALHWHSILIISVDDHITQFICAETFTDGEDARDEHGQRIQPSDYLRSCCPLCFGAKDWMKKGAGATNDYDGIICLDACFSQKRVNNPCNSTADDPLNPTDTIFIAPHYIKEMEEFMDHQCQSHSRKRCLWEEEVDDQLEDGMRVPASILDGCGESFTAADEKQQKTSTHFFADTGLMALLFRHDQVLCLVNMTSAGKKQHYALALLKRLFEHLPSKFTIGCLYDISCQLESFSVFHAYGHQWPCQLIYHPCKCIGFGLSDGEGCEHLWSCLKFLIPILRVSGHHQRLFVLDNQICYLDEKSFVSLGQWLGKKWVLSEEALGVLLVDEGVLRDEWNTQVAHQTKPLPRQLKDRAAKEISKVLTLEKSVDHHHTHVNALQQDLASPGIVDITHLNMQIMESQNSLEQATQALILKRRSLGLIACADLKTMKKDKYLQATLNAHALKIRIQEQVCHHKFEIERLERSYRNTINEHKLRSNTESTIKHREPTILKLVKAYNTACNNIHALIRVGRVPASAIPPTPILREDLFKLDIDDDIWLDVAVEGDASVPPRWLADKQVQQGIHLILQLDCCEEEESRLLREQSIIQEWITKEWLSIVHAKGAAGGKDSEAEEKVNDKEDGSSDEGSGLEDNDNVTGAVEDMALVEEYGLWKGVEEDSGEDDWEEYDSCMPSSPVKGPSSMKKMKLY